VEGVDHCTYL